MRLKLTQKLINMFKKIWNDPVGSKVIAVGIIGVLSILFAYIQSLVQEITFQESITKLYNLKIRVVYVILGGVLFLIGRHLFKGKGYYNKKQERLRKFNKMTVEQNDILLRWGVYFSFEGTPFIDDLTAFCTKHQPPMRFVNGTCPVRDCENSKQQMNGHMLKNHVESMLIDEWEKINKGS